MIYTEKNESECLDGVLRPQGLVGCCFFTIYFLCIEKAALLSPDDDVQKSDISSSSQSLMEKEALGPMLLEVRYIPPTCIFFKNQHL